MAISYVGAGTFSVSGSQTLNDVPLPAGLQDNDIIISVAKDRGGTGNLAMATAGANSDWTLIQEGLFGITGAVAYWARRSGGVDPSLPDWSGGTNHVYAQTFAFRGCVTSGSPIDATAAAEGASTNTTSVSGTSFNTATAEAWLIAAIGSGNQATQSFSSPNWADAGVANETIRAQNASIEGNGGALALVTADRAAAGASGAFSLTKSASDQHTLLMFALKPQPSGGVTATPRSQGMII